MTRKSALDMPAPLRFPIGLFPAPRSVRVAVTQNGA